MQLPGTNAVDGEQLGLLSKAPWSALTECGLLPLSVQVTLVPTFTVKVGTKVTWTDKGSNPHSVSADQGAFDSSPNCSPSTAFVPGNCMKSGDAFSFTFSSAGTFAYHCRVHTTSMKGTVTVVA